MLRVLLWDTLGASVGISTCTPYCSTVCLCLNTCNSLTHSPCGLCARCESTTSLFNSIQLSPEMMNSQPMFRIRHPIHTASERGGTATKLTALTQTQARRRSSTVSFP
jgi:hypothetical protein